MKKTLPLPRVLRIEPASLCNLRCTHCPTGTIAMERNFMQWSLFERVLDQIREHRDAFRVFVLYHGGEPLVNKEFFRMVSELRSLVPDAVIKTVSNGMLLNEKNQRALLNSGIDAVEISIDGTFAEDNNKIRRGADFRVVADNIKSFLELRREIWSARPALFISTTQFIDEEKLKTTADRQVVLPAFLEEEFSEALSRGEIEGFKPTFAMRWPHMQVDENLYSVAYDDFDSDEKNECDHVVSTMTIRSNGDIVPCCYDLTSQMVMGN